MKLFPFPKLTKELEEMLMEKKLQQMEQDQPQKKLKIAVQCQND